jgi:DNA-binding NarL/FixJ family response regulator
MCAAKRRYARKVYPVLPPTKQKSTVQVPPFSGASMMPNRIFIADDSQVVRDIIRIFLTNAGFTICGEASDGLAAIQRAQELKPDLIVLDLAMPLMDGAEAASVLKKAMPEVPVVFFTMYDETVCGALASAAGVDVVLTKSDGIRQLISCVHALLTDSEPDAV